MTEQRKRKCEACGSLESEYYSGSHGIKGVRCINKCLASYIIFTEMSVVASFPKEKELPRRMEKTSQ
jgi:hypothetical protein